MELKVTTLIENDKPIMEGLVNEFGLSLYIETENCRLLFDTGQTGDFVKNAEKLGIDLNKIDYVILSHGHFDHANGVPTLLEHFRNRPVMFAGEGFFEKKYKQLEDGTYIDGSVKYTKKQLSDRGIEFITIRDNQYYLRENIVIFNNFERISPMEELREEFVIKKNDSYVLDDFSDEITIGIITSKGLVVIVGCSHVGIVNILSTIEKRVNMPIYAVIGGTHLIDADADRIECTIKEFERMGIQRIALSHCTGELGIKILQAKMQDKFICNNTGNVIVI